ncbi:hypothetical protein PM082_004259 [Marasmius tenuissimus]|nr:hypothetical protein PM082_004259 [Marasmius tenuissimus]
MPGMIADARESTWTESTSILTRVSSPDSKLQNRRFCQFPRFCPESTIRIDLRIDYRIDPRIDPKSHSDLL